MTTVRDNGQKQNAETSVIREYSGLTPTYDIRWASYITATLRETLKRSDIKPTDRVLDIGCGTGSLLQAISQINWLWGMMTARAQTHPAY